MSHLKSHRSVELAILGLELVSFLTSSHNFVFLVYWMPQRGSFCELDGMAGRDLFLQGDRFLMESSSSPNQTERPEAFPLARGWSHRPGSSSTSWRNALVQDYS